MIRVVVCGGQDFTDQRTIDAALDAVRRRHEAFEVVAVGSSGPALIATLWAASRGLPFEQHEPMATPDGTAWEQLNRYVVDLGTDAVVAFPGRGATEHMVGVAEASGVPVWRPKPLR